jgi:hypothetical protein
MDATTLSYSELRSLQRDLEKEAQRRLHVWANVPAALVAECKTWLHRDVLDLSFELHFVKSQRGTRDRRTYRHADALLDVLGRELTRRRLLSELDGVQAQPLSLNVATSA